MRPVSNPRKERAHVELTSTAAASPAAAATASVICRLFTRRVFKVRIKVTVSTVCRGQQREHAPYPPP